MAREVVCCCDTSGWAKAMAGLQMVASFFTTILCFATLFKTNSTVDYLKKSVKGFNPEEGRLMIYIFGVVGVTQSLVTFAFGILLLAGIYSRSMALLNTWLFFNVIFSVLEITAGILEAEYVGEVNKRTVIHCVITMIVRVFSIGIVALLRNEFHSDKRLHSAAVMRAFKNVNKP